MEFGRQESVSRHNDMRSGDHRRSWVLSKSPISWIVTASRVKNSNRLPHCGVLV